MVLLGEDEIYLGINDKNLKMCMKRTKLMKSMKNKAKSSTKHHGQIIEKESDQSSMKDKATIIINEDYDQVIEKKNLTNRQ